VPRCLGVVKLALFLLQMRFSFSGFERVSFAAFAVDHSIHLTADKAADAAEEAATRVESNCPADGFAHVPPACSVYPVRPPVRVNFNASRRATYRLLLLILILLLM